MLDPQLFRVLALSMGLLFLLAGLHKISDRQRFGGILADYQILPTAMVAPASLLIPLLELSIGFCWLLGALILNRFPLSAVNVLSLSSAALLSVYALAMAINLARGRSHIDCGCGFASHRDTATSQHLGSGLVLRNCLLAALALSPLLEVSARELTLLDHLLLIVAVPTLAFCYAALNQLLTNRGAISSWRKAHG